ncbi:unnamed protein product [Macrosiphum euphorbiae]|uniref:Integrase catalytic domain-containing protein n=1 Tax=Macrosiphum euphorbiae TaxID=13131 RepID=A0AAV0X7W8_9HEMI|nr:unnamed protein product [Macrosiphum euphorbiae]
MPLSPTETERAERLLVRTIAKRDALVVQMSLLHDLSKNVVHNAATVLPLFRARKRDIDSLLTQFKAEQDSILDMLVQLQRVSEYHTTHAPIDIALSEQYYNILAVAEEIGLNVPLTVSPVTVSSQECSHIQLPKIELPHFDGDFLQWIAFRDTFKSLVHDNSQIKDIEKYHHLLSAVSGSAGAVVRSLPLSASNYVVAWKALLDRFDNPRLIMNSHLDKLFSFSTLRSSSLDDLKHFLDIFQENIAALRSFDVPDKEGFLLFYLASRVLDSSTKCLFESQRDNRTIPVIDELLTFVQTRCQVLQNSAVTSNWGSPVKNKPTSYTKKGSSFVKTSLLANASESHKPCLVCNGPHPLYRCDKFIQQQVPARLKTVQTHRLCRNCISAVHDTSKCSSKYSCRHCSAKHHSLLHLDTYKTKGSSNLPSSSSSTSGDTSKGQDVATVNIGTVSRTNLSVLGTASIRIQDKCGHWIPCRALIDSGSQVSAITHNCATQLGLTRRHSAIDIVGLSQTPISRVKGVITCLFTASSTTSPEYSCEPIVLRKITGTLPSIRLNPSIRSHYSALQFADPFFDRPGRIDFLLGADVYNQLFTDESRVHHSPGFPSAFETRLGWIFIGPIAYNGTEISPNSLTIRTEPSLDKLLHRFWTVEEPVVKPIPFTEEQKCEDWFVRTTRRDESGRYIVTFPFKSDPCILGGSRTMALSRFLNLERKLQVNDELYAEYRAFMDAYIKLGHMHLATLPGKYIIPHHAVVKSVNDSIKLRVVFDASARTSSGSSLNDIVFTGQKLQQDISTLLMSCRLQRYMFTADICKMYRQIKLSHSDQQYQHILWRDCPSDPLQEYALSTVTYGVACSPFQAIRVLHQLEADEGAKFPATKNVLTAQTYVDDIITGAQSVESVLTLQNQLCNLLASGGFILKKWASNSPEVLQTIPVEDRVLELSFDPKDDACVKILGLHWDPVTDTFTYHSDHVQSALTKRAVLSSIAKIYDPLGALAPITFWAKCFMQRLWKEGYEWDSPISSELASAWALFASELPLVSGIRIARHIPVQSSSHAQLIGFSDASLKGYAALVYLRLLYVNASPTIHLITAKSKVASLKSGQADELLSVPRLELCGALLLAQVLQRVQGTMASVVRLSSIHAWTDSTVVLSWLTNVQVQYKIFVTNRLNKIKELIPTCKWHHVVTSQNPADCVSRGMFPKDALDHRLYWDGPSWLYEPNDEWSSAAFQPLALHEVPEQASHTLSAVTLATHVDDPEWFKRFSSLTRLQRVISYMHRFTDRARKRQSVLGYIRHTELERSLFLVIRLTQDQHFSALRKSLTSVPPEASPISLARLSPYIDSEGIIRVGGRLRHSVLHDEAKNPILLPKVCSLSTLLIRHYHLQYLHAGPQLISSLLVQRYWIMSARAAIRRITFKCISCTRQKATAPIPMMADLPPARVRPSRPFAHVGVDYAGPFLIKEGRRKQARSVKGYLALFVCMVIKAVHIEVVSDLTTDAFIAALHRFVSRRGLPSDIYSDCGTNFKGANRDLQRLFSEPAAQELYSGAIACHWHFNPPASLHFGGLWEAAVKSCKYHLKRVIGTQMLTFEEMATLVSRIEAILNSRPITPQSSSPHDLNPLTPGHFLVGGPLVTIAEPDLTTTPMNRLRRWQLLTLFHQSFWTRWAAEYLTSLQNRAKWIRPQLNIEVGDLVIVRCPNSPPTAWKLGRVESTHPGDDGVVRVVTVRTTDGTFKRPCVKLVVLPTPDDP